MPGTEPQPLEELLEEPFAGIAQKLASVEQIPTWEELVRLFDYLREDERVRYGRNNSWKYGSMSGLWDDFCKEKHIYHAFCYEFVEKLAEEVKGLNAGGRVVEICAGNGKLSYWLRQFGVPSIATDNYMERMDRKPQHVERLSHKQALGKYRPELVIGCWLYGGGIELDALDSPHVGYYLNIGQGVMGATGDDRLWDRRDVTQTYLESPNHFKFSRSTYRIDGAISDANSSFATLFTKTVLKEFALLAGRRR